MPSSGGFLTDQMDALPSGFLHLLVRVRPVRTDGGNVARQSGHLTASAVPKPPTLRGIEPLLV